MDAQLPAVTAEHPGYPPPVPLRPEHHVLARWYHRPTPRAPARRRRRSAREAGDAARRGRPARASAALPRRRRSPPLNDLAVDAAPRQGERRPRAGPCWTTCLTLDPTTTPTPSPTSRSSISRASLTTRLLARARRRSAATDPSACPSAHIPGMPLLGTMSEHATRYALALGRPAAVRHVLDVGCGTGYGSEMLTWTGASRPRLRPLGAGRRTSAAWPGGAELHLRLRRLQAIRCRAADAAVDVRGARAPADAPAALRQRLRRRVDADGVVPEPEVPRLAHQPPPRQRLVAGARREGDRPRGADAASDRSSSRHLHQPPGMPSIIHGRDPEAPFWIVLAQGVGAAPAGQRPEAPPALRFALRQAR